MVSRARVLLVAVPFFGSLAVIAFSLVHLGRWPMLVQQTRELDVQVDWASFGPYPIEVVPEDHRSVVASALLVLASIALLGTTLLAVLKRSAVASLPWVVVSVLSAALVGSLVNPLLVVPVQSVVWFVTLACATAVVQAIGTTERPLVPLAAVLAVVVLAGLAIPVVDMARQPAVRGLMEPLSTAPWRPSPEMTPWPSWFWLAGLVLCGAGVGLLRIELRRSALWGVASLALVLGRFAAASAADWSAVSRMHPGIFSVDLKHQYPAMRWCPASPVLAPQVSTDDGEVYLSGTLLGTTTDAAGVGSAAVGKLAEIRRQFIELHEQAGDLVSVPTDLNLVAEVGTPLPIVIAVAAAGVTNGMRRLHFVTFQPPYDRLRTFPAVHLHACAASVELTDDGVPMSSFSDWPALLRAADEARTVLRVSPR